MAGCTTAALPPSSITAAEGPDKLIGSTSERVVHHAPCPVVIVPDPRHAERNLVREQARQAKQQPSHPVQVV